MRIRVSQGVGSNAKLWGVLYAGAYSRQVMELDLPPAPLTAIIWGPIESVIATDDAAQNTRDEKFPFLAWDSPYGLLGMINRRAYASVDDVVAEMAKLWPDAEILRHDDEPLGRI